MAIYKNLPRGKQKQHDEFRDWTMHAIIWVKENWKLALELVVACAVAFAIVVGANTYWRYRSENAAEAFYAAAKLPPDSPDKISKLEEVVSDYSRTPAGRQAMMLLGDIFEEKKEYDKAKDMFQKLAGRSRNHPILTVAALHKLAEIEYSKGDFTACAEDYLKAAANPHNILSARSRYFAAGCFEKAGDAERAKTLYEQVISDAKNDDADRLIKEQSEERLIWLASKK